MDAGNPSRELDDIIAELLQQQETTPTALDPAPLVRDEEYELGRYLFFDPILSGNRDVSCATCHNPDFGTSDGISLSIGTGGNGEGPQRVEGSHPPFVPRHAMDLFNRGHADIKTLFWDGRVRVNESNMLEAGITLPPGLSGALAAQSLLPMLDRLEMRGYAVTTSTTNELAAFDDGQIFEIWSAMVERLLQIDGYQRLFAEAYPATELSQINIAHVANALAAFQTRAFEATNTPWDNYLRGNKAALTTAQKLGVIFFFDSAQCGRCHSGPHLSDHDFHNTAVPVIGPGYANGNTLDYGRYFVTGLESDKFRFRTSPLRNVMHTAPYMHNGSLVDLQDVLKHYAAPLDTAKDFTGDKLLPELQSTVDQEESTIAALTSSVAEEVIVTSSGTSFIGLSNLRQFMHALTDPSVEKLHELRPESLPADW